LLRRGNHIHGARGDAIPGLIVAIYCLTAKSRARRACLHWVWPMRVSALLVLLLTPAAVLGQALPPVSESGPCSLAGAQAATVVEVDADLEPMLDDGRRISLAGLDFPQGEGDRAKLRKAALARLSSWLAGADVFVEAFASAPDRWGRVPAQIVAPAAPTPEAPLVSVGAALIAEGFARFRPDPKAAACAKTYLAAESFPREHKLGFWALDPEIEVSSVDPAAVEALARKKGMATVSGTVQSVGETASAIYLNLGSRRRADFAVVISKRNLGIFSRDRIIPHALSGRRVRVRGLIETNYGPRMQISSPAEIELVGQPAPR
jgi:endonuclease YncB( thermonuclease family)